MPRTLWDALILINPDPYWLILYRVLRFRETTQNALRTIILRYPLPPAYLVIQIPVYTW